MQFVVVGLDGTDEEAKNRRDGVRQDHIKTGEELLKSGNLLYGAVLLNDDGSMKGSLYVMNFPSSLELDAYLKTEPYVVGEVWQDLTVHESNTRDPWQFSHDKTWFDKYL